MRGLLADANLAGQLTYIRFIHESLGFSSLWNELGVALATFRDVHFLPDVDDRTLWNDCQELGWVLLTDNRNHAGRDSFEAVLRDSWQVGCLPILTLANKRRFDRDAEYAQRTALEIAELLFDLANQKYRGVPRIYIPR